MDIEQVSEDIPMLSADGNARHHQHHHHHQRDEELSIQSDILLADPKAKVSPDSSAVIHINYPEEYRPTPRRPSTSSGSSANGAQLGESNTLEDDENVHVHMYLPGWKSQVQSMRRRTAIAETPDNMPKKVSKFYRKQNRLIEKFENNSRLVEGDLESHETPESNTLTKSAIWLIRGSLGANVLLLIAKVIVAVQSGSISVLASAFDSLLDLLSGAILTMTARAITKRDPFEYPQGKTRLEPIGLIVLASVMTMVSINVILEALKRIFFTISPMEISFADLILLVAIVGTKTFLFIICRKSRNSMVLALAQDHRNDILTNTLGTIGALLGANVWMYFDPIIAILFSSFVIWTWSNTAKENVRTIVGKSAPPRFLQQLTFLAINHDDRIIQVDTVRAFHFGANYLVEVDIVLPREMMLQQTHDIGESLQMKLEMLPEVDRAFVHIDYETTHKPEHKAV